MDTEHTPPPGGDGSDPFAIVALASAGVLAGQMGPWQATLAYVGILLWAAWVSWHNHQHNPR